MRLGGDAGPDRGGRGSAPFVQRLPDKRLPVQNLDNRLAQQHAEAARLRFSD